MPEWSPDVAVDKRLVHRLLRAQFPDLAELPLRLLAEGWDNAVWLVGERWVFRIPRRAIAIPGVEREIRVLPHLAPMLPLPIPMPTFVGRSSPHYPWPFFAAPLLLGREVADAGLPEHSRIGLGRPLGEFLRALHAPAVYEAVGADLPIDPMGRADMSLRVPRTVQRLEEVERMGLWQAPRSVWKLLARAAELSPARPRSVVHGDLHARHLLINETARPTAVIDWGDMCRADPSVDLSLALSLLPPEGLPAFVDAYGPVSAERWLRARVMALFLCATLAVYAKHEGMVALEREMVTGLMRAVG